MKAAELIAKAQNLQAPSPAMVQMLGLLTEPEVDNEDLIRLISQDAIVSAKLLGMCNAAVYGLTTPVTSIDQAVLYLGHTEIQRLAMNAGFAGSLSPSLKGYAIGETELWQHSLLTAYISVMLSERSPHPVVDPAIAYTGGLIHDIGKIVINRALTPELQAIVIELLDKKERTLIAAEREVIGTDHAEVGAELLKNWRLPEILIEAVANHHQPVSKPHAKLSALVHVADLIALEAGRSPGIGSYAFQPDEAAIGAIGLKPENLEGLILEAYDTLAEVESMRAV